MWLTDPDISARSIGVPGGFADPYRWTHLHDPRIASVYGTPALEVFAREWSIALPPGTGLPGDGEYLAALDRHLTAAARGEMSAQQAMAGTARTWESITERYGRESQIGHWLAFTGGFEVAQ
jgi:multiple sugar transport system substrate-binding protein